jgi:hypothetical protein
MHTTATKEITNDWLGGPHEELLGFSWKHGTTADTKGVMMWSDVFLYDAPNGEKIAIVVIDTQGLFEKGSTTEENGKIFSFSTLISSIQIINIKERIEESQIKSLQSAIDLTKLITKKQKNSTWKAFQSLIFLLRDFEDENFEFGFEGGLKYFNNFFSISNNESTKASVNRNSIRESFDNILCFLINHPGLKIKTSKCQGQWGMLEEKFVKNLKILIESLLAPEKLVKKKILGKEINAGNFKDIFVAYLMSYSNYETLPVDDIYQIAVDNEMGLIVKEEVKNYKEKLYDGEVDYARVDFVGWLQKKHQTLKDKAVNNFLSADKIEDTESEEKFKHKLNNETEEVFKSWQKSTMDSYTTHQMQAIVNKILAFYRKEINENVDYKEENFIDSIQEKHDTLKLLTTFNFTQQAQELNDENKLNKFIDILKDDLENNFVTWKKQSIKLYLDQNFKTKIEKYKESINNGVDFENENFSEWLDNRHQFVQAQIIKEFTDIPKIDNFMRQPYDEELKKLTHDFFTIFKSQKIQEQIKFIEDQQERLGFKLNLEIINKVEEYKSAMEIAIEYNRTDFETWFRNRHENIKKFTINEFSKLPEMTKFKRTQEMKLKLDGKLENTFEIIKKYHVDLYMKELRRKNMIFFTKLIDENFEKYKNIFEANIVYGKNDFADYIIKKHNTAKDAALAVFDQALKPEYEHDKDEFRQILKDKADSYFNTWKTSGYNLNEKEWEKKTTIVMIAMNRKANNLFREYESRVNNFDELEKIFAIDDKLVDVALKEFRAQTNSHNHTLAQERVSLDFEEKIYKLDINWRINKPSLALKLTAFKNYKRTGRMNVIGKFKKEYLLRLKSL